MAAKVRVNGQPSKLAPRGRVRKWQRCKKHDAPYWRSCDIASPSAKTKPRPATGASSYTRLVFATQNPTKLSLYEFAQALGLSTLHVAGIEVEEIKGTYCASPWLQYAWMDADRVGREAIGRAIATAEDMMETYLGFRLLPSYEADERHATTKPYHPEFVNFTGRQVGGFNSAVRTTWGYVLDYGRRKATPLTIIQQTLPGPVLADLVWTPSGYWEVAEVLVDATGITDPQEIRVFYPGKGSDPAWEIRPITVSIDGGSHIATITFPRELGVLESIWNALVPGAAEGSDDANFVSTVGVYRIYTDASDQASFRWEQVTSCGVCDGIDGGCPACSFRTMAGCITTRGDPRLGLSVFRPAAWDEDTRAFLPRDFEAFRQPDDIALNYLAGWEDPNKNRPRLEMAPKWREAVAYLAASLLERPPCDCSPDYWERWREDVSTDVSYFGQGGHILRVAPNDLSNPFGTRRGAIWAWKRCTDGLAIGQGVEYR